MITLGYLLAVIVGFSLGVLGTGGAILTIPILVYIWHFQDKQAIASGFVIVVLVGLMTAWKHFKDGHINFRLLALFAPSTMFGTHFGVTLSQHVPGAIQLFMLAIIMSTSALLMLLPSHSHHEATIEDEEKPFKVSHPVWFLCLGVCVGLLVGLVGIGGGFIILPILVTLAHVPMRQAIGTTLMVAVMNSIVGGLSCMQHTMIPWDRVLSFAAVAVFGGIAGAYMNSRLPVPVLRKAFATVLIIVASAIVYENISHFARNGTFLSSSSSVVLIK